MPRQGSRVCEIVANEAEADLRAAGVTARTGRSCHARWRVWARALVRLREHGLSLPVWPPNSWRQPSLQSGQAGADEPVDQ